MKKPEIHDPNFKFSELQTVRQMEEAMAHRYHGHPAIKYRNFDDLVGLLGRDMSDLRERQKEIVEAIKRIEIKLEQPK